MTNENQPNSVLIIDRDEAVCSHLSDILTARGFDVKTACTGRGGLDLYMRGLPALVLLDLAIQDLDVRYMIREMKRLDEQAAVVLMGYPDETDLVEETQASRATDFLEKPLRSDRVIFRVRQLLEVRALLGTRIRSLEKMEESAVQLQKQHLMLARRTEESLGNLAQLCGAFRETYLRSLRVLAHALDSRHRYTYSHCDNVARCAELIGRRLGVESAYLDDMREACYLHDLGKMALPATILTKPGALSPEEAAEMRLHPVRGAQLLEPLTFMPHVVAFVRHHHERWDGRGYPDGLSGERIPLGARIMAVADSYDAMVSPRPYRRTGLSLEEAKEEFARHSGSQFDPKVVSVFLRSLEEL
ncbi:MAG: HD domain-containing phosphohydrolase [Deltaproteobacteria bacterium]